MADLSTTVTPEELKEAFDSAGIKGWEGSLEEGHTVELTREQYVRLAAWIKRGPVNGKEKED